ncbi:unnamed protein product [Euphydryas editha]|uniref:Uncharacterized protein n=1 Tax=Euphydryas editha TaxID=104508 RepID=A0AAU9TY04_EUPED|nr:unnamed protein product [Euphydryas editha]
MEELNRLPPKYIATFIRQINMIQIFGINIFEDSKDSFFKRRIRLFFFGGLLTIMLTSQYLYVFNINEMGAEFLDIVSAMSNIFIVSQGYIKMSIVTYKRDQIKELIMEMGKIWRTEIDNEEKERTLNSWTRRLKLFDNALFTAAIVSLIFFELLPVIHLIYAFITNGDLQFQLPVQMHFVCPSSLQCPYKYALGYIFQLIVGKFVLFYVKQI